MEKRAGAIGSVQADILIKKQYHRINFDSRAQMREYLLYYRRSGAEFRRTYTQTQRTIIALTLMCWPKRKIMSRTRPGISDWQIKQVNKQIPCLQKIKRILSQLSGEAKDDAMHYVVAALDINGNVTRRED